MTDYNEENYRLLHKDWLVLKEKLDKAESLICDVSVYSPDCYQDYHKRANEYWDLYYPGY